MKIIRAIRHPLFIVLVISALLNALLWFLALTLFPRGSDAAILHYSSDIGIDFVGEGSHITVLPGIGTLVLLANALLGQAIARADVRASWVLWSIIPFIELVLLVAFLLIWRINV